jgi:hypothetical protein
MLSKWNMVTFGVRVLSGSSSGDNFLSSVEYGVLGETTAVESYSISSLFDTFWFAMCSATTPWIGNTDLWSSGCYYFSATGIGIAYWMKTFYLKNFFIIRYLIFCSKIFYSPKAQIAIIEVRIKTFIFLFFYTFKLMKR